MIDDISLSEIGQRKTVNHAPCSFVLFARVFFFIFEEKDRMIVQIKREREKNRANSVYETSVACRTIIVYSFSRRRREKQRFSKDWIVVFS